MFKIQPPGSRAMHATRARFQRRAGATAAFAALMWPGVKAAAAGAAACTALASVAIPNTTITSATYVTSPTGANYCQVNATVAPEHDVQVRLPDLWRQRYVQNGRASCRERVYGLV